MSTRLKKQIRRWRYWLMQREQQFQQRLKTPAEVVADQASLNLMAQIEAGNLPLPQLKLKPLTGWQQESWQPAAFLFKITAASLSMIKELKRRHNVPLILWADNDANAALLIEADHLADLMIVLTDPGGLNSRNGLMARSIQEMAELIRIFAGSKINAGIISLAQ
jgi:hypothetical protein